MMLTMGSLFANRFEIGRIAGSGGMGTVYRARDSYTGELVALKLLNGMEHRSDELERFSREAQILSLFNHPGIVSYVAHGQTPDGQLFLAMEWLDGIDLAERLKRGPVSLPEALIIIKSTAEALNAAHTRGIVHRDIKPQNLFLPAGDISRIKILDFGIARGLASPLAVTRTGVVIGSVEYMSPEQARGERSITSATDIFSLGCVLYQCVTGAPPFCGEHMAAVLVRILFEDPAPVQNHRTGLPPSLCSLINDMLQKRPDNRIPDAAALLQRIGALSDTPVEPVLPTVVGVSAAESSFSDREQSLVTLVFANLSRAKYPLGGSESESLVQHRLSLLAAIRAFSARGDFLVDGALVVTVPKTGSAQDQALMAARIAREIRERWSDAIVVITTGRGSDDGAAAVGEVADRAVQIFERLNQDTSSSEDYLGASIWLDELSSQLLGPRYALKKTMVGTALIGAENQSDESRPLLGKATPCVGRDGELSALLAMLTSCTEDGAARVAIVTAPPGAGKSRLRHELVRRISQRNSEVSIVLGRADVMRAGAPYEVLRDALCRLCEVRASESLQQRRTQLRKRITSCVDVQSAERVTVFIGELCGVPFSHEGNPLLQTARQEPKLMQDCLRRAFLDWLAAEVRMSTVLLVFDDLQWSDELSISLLDEALHELESAPLLLLSLARPEVHTRFPNLWQRHQRQDMPLRGLGKKACERLIQSILGKDVPVSEVTRMIEQSAGNTLYLEELIRSYAEGGSTKQSDTVLAMLQARIGRLEPETRRAVRAASIFGQTFGLGGVAAILGASSGTTELTQWLLTASNAEVILPRAMSRVAAENEYGFRHPLLRDAAYSLLTPSDLAIGHRLAGEYLDRAGERDAAIIAEHFELGGEKSRAAYYYLAAAENVLDHGNYSGALRYTEMGIACAEDQALVGKFRSIESLSNMFLNKLESIEEAAQVALRRLPAGSFAWCRAAAPALWAVIATESEERIAELLELIIATEPDADARTTYVTALGQVHSILIFSAPMMILQRIVQRINEIVELAEATNPALVRLLYGCRGRMATFRELGPWTAVSELQRDIDICMQVHDTRLSIMIRATLIEWGWIELGDARGAVQRLTALKPEVELGQNKLVAAFWPAMLARALCELEDEAAWHQAEELVRPIATTKVGARFLTCLAAGVLARVLLKLGRIEESIEQAYLAMTFLGSLPILGAFAATTQMRGLMHKRLFAEAAAIADAVSVIASTLGGLGVGEVEFRCIASQAYFANGQIEQAKREQVIAADAIARSAADITDAAWQQKYVERHHGLDSRT